MAPSSHPFPQLQVDHLGIRVYTLETDWLVHLKFFWILYDIVIFMWFSGSMNFAIIFKGVSILGKDFKDLLTNDVYMHVGSWYFAECS